MRRIIFIKEAGERLFDQVTAAPADVAYFNQRAAHALKRYIGAQQLIAAGLTLKYRVDTRTVTVSGVALDQATQEKIVISCGNVSGVTIVEDCLGVATPIGAASKFRDMKLGDTLVKIAEEEYSDASCCRKIFEANKPMLSNPDKIYSGQMLRMPAP
mgnify:CR=1 FL=1